MTLRKNSVMATADFPDYWIGAIQCAGNEYYLTLPSGKWDLGQLECAELGPSSLEYLGENSGASRSQRWVIARIPDSQQWNIFNLYYGVTAGVYTPIRPWYMVTDGKAAPMENNLPVQVAPCRIGSHLNRWTFELSDHPKTWCINWSDGKRILDLDHNYPDGDVLACPPNKPISDNQKWVFSRDDTSFPSGTSRATWMKHVPDDTLINMMSIPGTHGSLALNGFLIPGDESERRGGLVDVAHYQDRSPYEQLMMGVRMLDLHFQYKNNIDWISLYAIVHTMAPPGPPLVDQGYSLAAVLHSVAMFLAQNPSEVVFLNVTFQDWMQDDVFFQAWDNDFAVFAWASHTYFQQWGGSTDKSTLGQLRGRALIISDVLANYVHSQKPAKYAGTDFFVTSDYFYQTSKGKDKNENANALARTQWHDKLHACAWNINNALADDGHNGICYRTSWDMCRPPDDYQKQPANMGYGALEFARYASTDASEHRVNHVLNKKRLGLGTLDKWKRVGFVNFAFSHMFEDAIWDVIRSNRGCGSLPDDSDNPSGGSNGTAHD